MTIKTRNKLNLSLCIFAILSTCFNAFILFLSIYRGTFSLDLYLKQVTKTNFLTQYNPFFVLISLYFQILYVCLTSFMLYRVFEKTKASDIIFIFLFLIAHIANTFRIWIPLFNLGATYSGLLMFCGNAILFSKLLIPLSLLYSVIMSSDDQRQDLEKNIFLLLLVCIFFAITIPLNTANVCLNFEVDYGYRKVIDITSVLIIIATLIAMFFNNRRKMYTQITTIGLAFISIGTYILINTINILRLALAVIFLTLGNILYLKELHKQYLWND